MNKKALILSIPMILAVFLLGGWFLFREPQRAPDSQKPPVVGENPTQNPGNIEPSTNVDTSNWKTYRNEEYGFELKYPGGWEIEKGANTFPGVVLVARDNAINGKELVEISIYAPALRELHESSGWKANDQVILNKMVVDFGENKKEFCFGPGISCISPCSGRFFTKERLYSLRYSSLEEYLPFDIARETCSEVRSSFSVL